MVFYSTSFKRVQTKCVAGISKDDPPNRRRSDDGSPGKWRRFWFHRDFLDLCKLLQTGSSHLLIILWAYSPPQWCWDAVLDCHGQGRPSPLSTTRRWNPSGRNKCPNRKGVYLRCYFQLVGRLFRLCELVEPEPEPKLKWTERYTPLTTKMSDDESTERERQYDANHSSHVGLRDETASCCRWHPPVSTNFTLFEEK